MIKRGPSPKRYYVLSYEIINKDWSADALGVLVYVLSRPDNWKIYPSQLAKKFNCGKHKMTRILKEIRDKGHAVYIKKRDASGKFSTELSEWIFTEEPQPENQTLVKQPQPDYPAPGNQALARSPAESPAAENQTLDKENNPPEPDYPEVGYPALDNRTLLNIDNKLNTDNPLKTEEGGKPLKKKRKRFVPPTVQEVTDYKIERNSSIDPNQFVDFYTGKDWMVGKNKMKDWQAAFRTWEKRESNHDTYRQTSQERRENYIGALTDYNRATDF